MKRFEIGDRVTITGRNGIGPQNTPIYGATGRIVSTYANAPDGWFSVWLDEPVGGYNAVNMPPEHLESADQPPQLKLV